MHFEGWAYQLLHYYFIPKKNTQKINLFNQLAERKNSLRNQMCMFATKFRSLYLLKRREKNLST